MKVNIQNAVSVAVLVVLALGTFAHTELEKVAIADVECNAHFRAPLITAKAAYVYDIKNQEVLFKKNEEVQLPLASLTKLATALVASNSLERTETLTIDNEALTPEGDSGLRLGEVWKIGDLIDFTLMTSSNDGARALALGASGDSLDSFLEAMNNFVQKIGAKQTFFLNETGLDVSSTTAGAYGSARDMALLLAYTYSENSDTLIGSTQSYGNYRSLSGFEHPATHTSSVAGEIPGGLVIKTGFTDLAGGNLVVLSEMFPGRPIAMVVLGAERETRDSDIKTLAENTKSALKRATLCDKY